MSSKSVRLVCFDLGGVLVRICHGWADASARAGVDLAKTPPAAWERHHALMLRYETGEIDEAGYVAALPDCAIGAPTEHVLRIFDAWLLGMYPGAAELLADLKRRPVQTACLSNTNQRHWRTFMSESQYDPLASLNHRFLSYEIGVMKPNERAFRRVEEMTGHRGGEILFFDDKPENVEAARRAGWTADLIDRVDDAASQVRERLMSHGVL